MIKTQIPIYLASQSPRRQDMLEMMGIKFRLLPVDIDEKINRNETPIKNVKRLAAEKCESALEKINNGIVIAADTLVVLEGQIIGKPKNINDAKSILNKLSAKTHYVYTGFSISNKSNLETITDYAKTKVYFRKLRSKEIEEYVKSGSPMDKAGAYGIQEDYGAVFVKKIEGCYYNVLGFPVSKIYEGIKRLL